MNSTPDSMPRYEKHDGILNEALNTEVNDERRLHASTASLLDAPNDVRAKAIIEDRQILYPALKEVMNEAEWMVYEPRQTRARGLIVCADRGNGKTSLARLVHQRYSDYDRSDAPCVLKISMSGTRDARSVYGRIMEELGSPARISHRLSDRELLVQRLLRDADCRLPASGSLKRAGRTRPEVGRIAQTRLSELRGGTDE